MSFQTFSSINHGLIKRQLIEIDKNRADPLPGLKFSCHQILVTQQSETTILTNATIRNIFNDSQ